MGVGAVKPSAYKASTIKGGKGVSSKDVMGGKVSPLEPRTTMSCNCKYSFMASVTAAAVGLDEEGVVELKKVALAIDEDREVAIRHDATWHSTQQPILQAAKCFLPLDALSCSWLSP
jgi:hypothetical protein